MRPATAIATKIAIRVSAENELGFSPCPSMVTPTTLTPSTWPTFSVCKMYAICRALPSGLSIKTTRMLYCPLSSNTNCASLTSIASVTKPRVAKLPVVKRARTVSGCKIASFAPFFTTIVATRSFRREKKRQSLCNENT